MLAAILLASVVSAGAIRVPAERASALAERDPLHCVDGQPCTVLAVRPIVPVALGSVQLGEQRFARDLAVGAGAALVVARGTWHVQSDEGVLRHTVEDPRQEFVVGGALLTGFTERDGAAERSTTLSALVGTRWLVLTAGYDISGGGAALGVAAVAPVGAWVARAWR